MDSLDPTFGMIESHRRAVAAYRAALGRLAPLRPGPELDAARAVASRASDVLGLASVELVETKPTTARGLEAWTRYVDECNRGDAEECLLPYFDNDGDGRSRALRDDPHQADHVDHTPAEPDSEHPFRSGERLSGEQLMRSIVAFLLGIAVTTGAAWVHDTAVAKPDDKPLVNWDQLGGVTHDAIEAARSRWNKLTSR